MVVEAAALHGESSAVQPNPRPVSIEDNILHQIDRIGYLRSTGQEWKEPVFHLRDLLVGLEDEEFWDGIPAAHRGKELAPDVAAAYAARGWSTMRVRMRSRKTRQGKESYLDPTAEELSAMLRIFMALLARRNMTWRRRNVDEIPMVLNGHDKGAGVLEAAQLVA